MACPSRLGDTGDVSNGGKEFKGFKEFELLRGRDEQLLHRPSVHVQEGDHRPFESGRGAGPSIVPLRPRIRSRPRLSLPQ
jgi:hypothetical protein